MPESTNDQWRKDQEELRRIDKAKYAMEELCRARLIPPELQNPGRTNDYLIAGIKSDLFNLFAGCDSVNEAEDLLQELTEEFNRWDEWLESYSKKDDEGARRKEVQKSIEEWFAKKLTGK